MKINRKRAYFLESTFTINYKAIDYLGFKQIDSINQIVTNYT